MIVNGSIHIANLEQCAWTTILTPLYHGCETLLGILPHTQAPQENGEWGFYGPLTRYAKLRVAHAPGMLGTFSPPPRFSDPDMNRGTCVTYVPWCMSVLLTSDFLWRRGEENVHSIPGPCATRNFAFLVRCPLYGINQIIQGQCGLKDLMRLACKLFRI